MENQIKNFRLELGQLIRRTREKKKLSQTDLAVKCGTTRHYISRIENGQSGIQLDTLQNLVSVGLGKSLVLKIKIKKTGTKI